MRRRIRGGAVSARHKQHTGQDGGPQRLRRARLACAAARAGNCASDRPCRRSVILVLTFVSGNCHSARAGAPVGLIMMTAERVLDALGDATRRSILARLRHRPCYAGELAQGMRVTRSAISQHLQVLRAAGLLTVEAQGTRRLYRVDRRGIEALRRWLDGFWDDTLDAFKDAAERAAKKRGRSSD